MDDAMLERYMHGEQLSIKQTKGYCLMTWHGFAIGLEK
jgi:NOL1/NOP2/fmu family ribosome biogenesis protein